MENNGNQLSHKDRLLQLIEEKVPDLTDVYQGPLTIIYRMNLWNFIEKVNWVDENQWSSPDAAQKCFDGFILEVERLILEESNPMMRVELECFKSKILNGPYSSCPEDFITDMAAMMHKENDMMKKYFFDQPEKPVLESLESVNSARSGQGESVMEQLKELSEILKCHLTNSLLAEREILSISGVHSLKGQELVNQKKANCVKIGQDCDKDFMSFFSTMELVEIHLKEAKRLFQRKLSFDSINLPMTEAVLSLEDLDRNFSMWTCAICSVMGDLNSYEKNVIQMCSEYPQRGMQSDLFSKLRGYKNKLSHFLSDYCQLCLVTIKCPSSQYHKSSSSSSKKEEEGEAPKKKATRSKMDKKENSPLNSTLKILGAQSFDRNFKVDLKASSVCLVNENLLPEYLPDGTECQFDPEDITRCGTLKPDSPPQLSEGFELKFYREEIQEPSRPKEKSSKADKEKASLVVASFSRFWYKINVEIFDERQTLFAVSHPIGWRTGSNQLLQFNGSLTWYHWNVENVYENLRIPQKVPVPRILAMLDAQVSDVKDNSNDSHHMPKYRSLSNCDLQFLQSWLVGENSTSEFVYLKDFICSKAAETKKRGSNDSGGKVQAVDFYTWFFALLKSLNGFLKGLWLDGLIYGICSLKTTSEVLMKDDTEVGTIMLRPSILQVHNTKCMEPRLDLALDFKTNCHKYDHVETIYWSASQIKHLPESLATHGRTLKYIQGVNNHISFVQILKNYFTNDETFVYHSTRFRIKMTFEILSKNDNEEDAGSVVTNEKQFKMDPSPLPPDSASCLQSPSDAFDHQWAATPATQHGDHEMSPSFSDTISPKVLECNDDPPSSFQASSFTQMASMQLQDVHELPQDLPALLPTITSDGNEGECQEQSFESLNISGVDDSVQGMINGLASTDTEFTYLRPTVFLGQQDRLSDYLSFTHNG